MYVRSLKYLFRTSYSLLNQKIANSSSSVLRDRRFHDHDHAWSCVISSFFYHRDRDRAWSDIFFMVVIVIVIKNINHADH
jgi:hypothetical protein